MFLLQPRRPSLTDFSFAPWFSPKYSESFLSLASRRSSLLSGLLCSPDVVPPFPRRFLPQILWSSQRLPRRFLPRLLRFSRLLPRRFSRLLPHRISRFSLAGSLGFSLAGSLGFSLAGSLGFSLAGSLAPPLVGQAPRGHPVPALHSHLHNSCSSLGSLRQQIRGAMQTL